MTSKALIIQLCLVVLVERCSDNIHGLTTAHQCKQALYNIAFSHPPPLPPILRRLGYITYIHCKLGQTYVVMFSLIERKKKGIGIGFIIFGGFLDMTIPNHINFKTLKIHYTLVVPLSFWHKLNYFCLFCRTFDKLFNICVIHISTTNSESNFKF